MTPLFKWAGSKRYLASALIPSFPPSFKTYIEPFCGSASLFFLLEPRNAMLGDLNQELINALECVKATPRTLARALEWLPADKDNYYLIRSLQPRNLTPFERAIRFLYLNRYCFNGLYRTNLAGQFNVPYGSKPKQGIDECTFISASILLRTAKLVVADFGGICKKAKSGDFVYLDPPYATSLGNSFTEYGARIFGVGDLKRLDKELVSLDKKGAYFMLSYSDGRDIACIARKWKTKTVQVRRNIAGFVGHRKSAQEVVVTNY